MNQVVTDALHRSGFRLPLPLPPLSLQLSDYKEEDDKEEEKSQIGGERGDALGHGAQIQQAA